MLLHMSIMKQTEKIMSSSILAILGFAALMKVVLSDDDDDDDEEIEDLREKEIKQIVLQSKLDSIQIFYDTVIEYLQQAKNPSFIHFMETKWNSDYNILIDSLTETGSTKRFYTSWREMYESIKKGNHNINHLLIIAQAED